MNITHSAQRPARGLIAELAAACAVEKLLGSEATVYGGSRKAVDIEAANATTTMTVDAKALVALSRSEAVRWGCRFQMARDRHRLFDSDAVTHIALVNLEDTEITIGVDGDARLTVEADLAQADVALVPVEVLNGYLDPKEGARRNWRFLIIDDELLEQYRI